MLRVMPATVKQRRMRRSAPAMTETLSGLAVRSSFEVTLAGHSFFGVELANGTQLIGEEPRMSERLAFDWVAAEKNVSPRHVKVLLDVATRYLYPHMGAGYLRMRWSAGERGYFHPQHTNFASEDSSLDEAVKKEIAKVFKPASGWVVIDVGAYLGHGGVWMAQQVGPTGRVLCVDAKELNVAAIREHARRNQLEQLDVRQNAIWKSAGETIEFHVTDRQANAVDAEVVSGDSVQVVTTSLPALIEDLQVVPQLVSLTVNGAEVEAIEGLKELKEEMLPERILAPGWYRKDGKPRAGILSAMLEDLGYKVAVTEGLLVFAWRV